MNFCKLPLAVLLFVFASCATNSTTSGSASQTNENLTVSAAVSLKDAFSEIGELYKNKTGKTVVFNFGASGALQKQIETGAPVDVFASAGEKQMDELAAKNLVEDRRNFAKNRLVLIVPADSKSNLPDLSRLTETEVRKIAVGNPKTVPAGQYTQQVFEKLKLQNSLQPKLIFAEDVRQVLDYVVRGEVDAGIVYASDAQTGKEKIRVAAEIAEDAHDPILYPIAVIKDSRQKASAREFSETVLSPEGQIILQKHGFAGAGK